MQLHRKIFFLILVLIPTQLGLHLWPAWTTVLGRRIDYLSPTIYLTDILIILVLGLYFLGSQKVRFPKLKINLTRLIRILLILGLIILNIVLAKSPQAAIYQWLKTIEYFGLGLYIVKTKPNLKLISFGLSIGIIYSVAIALMQFYLQHAVGGIFWFLGERSFSAETAGIAKIDLGPAWGLKLRPYATFPHPNVLAGFLAISLLFVWDQILKIRRHDRTFYYYLFVISLGYLGLILTFSRSAIILGLLTGIIFITTRLQKKFRVYAFLIFILISGLLLTFIKFNPIEESIVVRGDLNMVAFRLWQLSPVIGIGAGNFLIRLPEMLPSRQIYFLQPVHNIYLLWLVQTGLIGLIIFALYIFQIIRKIRSVNPVVVFSLVTILLIGLFDHYFLTLQQGQIILTLILSLALVKF